MMKKKVIPNLIAMCCVSLFAILNIPVDAAAGVDGKAAQPAISIKEPVYTSQSVMEGKAILHDFIVENKGNAPLEIISVQPT